MKLTLSPTDIFIIIYVAVVSLVGVILTVYDKAAAKKSKNGKGRVPENTLIYLGVLGGALPMYVTMRLIRHKTRHNKFMLGLPVITLVHILIAVVVRFAVRT